MHCPKNLQRLKDVLYIGEQVDGKNQGNKGFIKYAHKLVKEDSPILIQYIGYSDFSKLSDNGNTKDKSRTFIPTKKRVLNKLKTQTVVQDSRKLYQTKISSSVGKDPTEMPRDKKQVEN